MKQEKKYTEEEIKEFNNWCKSWSSQLKMLNAITGPRTVKKQGKPKGNH